MWKIVQPLIRWGKDERGATAVEYGLILALIVIAMIAALSMLADSTITMWNTVSDEVSSTG